MVKPGRPNEENTIKVLAIQERDHYFIEMIFKDEYLLLQSRII